MIESAQGELQLLSTNGQVDLTQFKQNVQEPLKKLGPLMSDAQALADWPDVLNYEVLEARWQPAAGAQRLWGRLDNLRLDAVARIDADLQHAASDQLAASGTLTFAADVEPIAFPVPPILQDLPLPFGCEGTTIQPQCRLDAEASKQLLVDALQGRGPGGLAEKIDELIERKVPEQYQRAARSLLEILGHSIEDEDADELEDFLGDDPDELVEEDTNGG